MRAYDGIDNSYYVNNNADSSVDGSGDSGGSRRTRFETPLVTTGSASDDGEGDCDEEEEERNEDGKEKDEEKDELLRLKHPDLFAVLVPTGGTLPQPGEQTRPQINRIRPSRQRRNRLTAFAIMTETPVLASPASSGRTSAASGRVSPFRGRGFRAPDGSQSLPPSPPPQSNNNNNALQNFEVDKNQNPIINTSDTSESPSRIPTVSRNNSTRRGRGSLSRSLSNIPRGLALRPPPSPRRILPIGGRKLSPIVGTPRMSPDDENKRRKESRATDAFALISDSEDYLNSPEKSFKKSLSSGQLTPTKIPRSTSFKTISSSSDNLYLSRNTDMVTKGVSRSGSRVGSKVNSRAPSRDTSPNNRLNRAPSPTKRVASRAASPDRRGTSRAASPSRRGTSRAASPNRRGTSRAASPNRRGTSRAASPNRRGTSRAASPDRRGTSRAGSPNRRGTSRIASPVRNSTSRVVNPTGRGAELVRKKSILKIQPQNQTGKSRSSSPTKPVSSRELSKQYAERLATKPPSRATSPNTLDAGKQSKTNSRSPNRGTASTAASRANSRGPSRAGSPSSRLNAKTVTRSNSKSPNRNTNTNSNNKTTTAPSKPASRAPSRAPSRSSSRATSRNASREQSPSRKSSVGSKYGSRSNSPTRSNNKGALRNVTSRIDTFNRLKSRSKLNIKGKLNDQSKNNGTHEEETEEGKQGLSKRTSSKDLLTSEDEFIEPDDKNDSETGDNSNASFEKHEEEAKQDSPGKPSIIAQSLASNNDSVVSVTTETATKPLKIETPAPLMTVDSQDNLLAKSVNLGNEMKNEHKPAPLMKSDSKTMIQTTVINTNALNFTQSKPSNGFSDVSRKISAAKGFLLKRDSKRDLHGVFTKRDSKKDLHSNVSNTPSSSNNTEKETTNTNDNNKTDKIIEEKEEPKQKLTTKNSNSSLQGSSIKLGDQNNPQEQIKTHENETKMEKAYNGKKIESTIRNINEMQSTLKNFDNLGKKTEKHVVEKHQDIKKEDVKEDKKQEIMNNNNNNNMTKKDMKNTDKTTEKVDVTTGSDSSLRSTMSQKVKVTIVSEQVRPLRIEVKEKPSEGDVQSGNMRPMAPSNGAAVPRGAISDANSNTTGQVDDSDYIDSDSSQKPSLFSRVFACGACRGKLKDDMGSQDPLQSGDETPMADTTEATEKPGLNLFGCFRKKSESSVTNTTQRASQVSQGTDGGVNKISDVSHTIPSIEEEQKTCWTKVKNALCGCCKTNKVGDSRGGTSKKTGCRRWCGCCSCCGRKEDENWAKKRDSIISDAPTRKWWSCFSCRSCRKGRGGLEDSRRTSMAEKKKSYTPSVKLEPQGPKMDESLVEHMSLMRGAVPVLPVWLAWLCLGLNVGLPGTGTVLSGALCLCIGKPRFSVFDGPKLRVGAFLIDLFVGVAQLFTVVFCFVGWGWSIWWGVIMIKTAKKYRRLQLAESMGTGPKKSDVERGLPSARKN